MPKKGRRAAVSEEEKEGEEVEEPLVSKKRKRSKKKQKVQEEEEESAEEGEHKLSDESDGWNSDLMGDAEDQKMLGAMTERAREEIISERADIRDALTELRQAKRLAREQLTTQSQGELHQVEEDAMWQHKTEPARSRTGRHKGHDQEDDYKFSTSAEREHSLSALSDQEAEREERPKKVHEAPLRLVHITRMQLRRTALVRVFLEPFFNEYVSDRFARVQIGLSSTREMRYAMCQVTGVQAYKRPYRFAERDVKEGLLLRIGKKEKVVPMSNISDRPITQKEMDVWEKHMSTQRVPIPSGAEVVAKYRYATRLHATFQMDVKTTVSHVERVRQVRFSGKHKYQNQNLITLRLEKNMELKRAEQAGEMDLVLKAKAELEEIRELLNRAKPKLGQTPDEPLMVAQRLEKLRTEKRQAEKEARLVGKMLTERKQTVETSPFENRGSGCTTGASSSASRHYIGPPVDTDTSVWIPTLRTFPWTVADGEDDPALQAAKRKYKAYKGAGLQIDLQTTSHVPKPKTGPISVPMNLFVPDPRSTIYTLDRYIMLQEARRLNIPQISSTYDSSCPVAQISYTESR